MRIIGGIAGGKILKSFKGADIRPTPDLVRQALFNSLGDRVCGRTVLELFAGTGALSLECISRGARSAVCVEKSEKHARLIYANYNLTGLPGGALQVWVEDAFSAIQKLAASGQTFDLILADPPYGEKTKPGVRSVSYAQRLLDQPELAKILKPDGLFILGNARRDVLSIPGFWHELKILRHGDSIIRFLEVIGNP